jgi:hypothetical protein
MSGDRIRLRRKNDGSPRSYWTHATLRTEEFLADPTRQHHIDVFLGICLLVGISLHETERYFLHESFDSCRARGFHSVRE